MKKLLLSICLLIITLSCFSQGMISKRKAKPGKLNYALTKPYPSAIKDVENFLKTERNPTVSSALLPTERIIGATRYDLQTNQSTQNRLYMFPDRTMGGVWTRGLAETNFPDRGTGYNFFDGTTWAPAPTDRIEPLRTGWPSYVPLGANGEIVISHTDVAGLSIDKRTTRNSGAWEHSVLAGPAGAVDISWPRTVTSGPNHEVVHVICVTYVTYQNQREALLYYRSSDGGVNWEKKHVIIPGLDYTNYKSIGGDSYAFADPRGDTLAFVVGDNWMDLLLMKSTDAGENWSKTLIFQNPYPMFEETHTLVTDTPTVVDGSLAVALDKHGVAHVFFGVLRVLNNDTTDNKTTYFPFTDGLGYWKEGMPMLTNVTMDTLEAKGELVGWTQDINGNDTILEFDDVPAYQCSVTGMPNVTIDENGRMFLVMTSVVEGLTNNTQNYRHIYGRMSDDDGDTWSGFIDITGSITHNFHECVYPTLPPMTRMDTVDLIAQLDDEPGLAVSGDLDPYTDNNIVHFAVSKASFGVGINEKEPVFFSVPQNYPNPASGTTTILVNLNRPTDLNLTITDITGRTIRNIRHGMSPAGTNSFVVDCTNLRQGVYFYTVEANHSTVTGKMLVQ